MLQECRVLSIYRDLMKTEEIEKMKRLKNQKQLRAFKVKEKEIAQRLPRRSKDKVITLSLLQDYGYNFATYHRVSLC